MEKIRKIIIFVVFNISIRLKKQKYFSKICQKMAQIKLQGQICQRSMVKICLKSFFELNFENMFTENMFTELPKTTTRIPESNADYQRLRAKNPRDSLVNRAWQRMEGNKKSDEYRRQTANSKVENINNPTKEVVEEHSQIYNSLPEDEKQKWDECVKEAKEKYYAMMTDLGYENVEKKFTFFEPYLANSDSRDFRLNTVAFFTNDKANLCTKYSIQYVIKCLDLDPNIIVSTMVHENIHANDNNKELDHKISKSGLAIAYKEKEATANYTFWKNIIEKMKTDWKTLDKTEQEFIQTILDKDLEKFASYFSWFADKERILNDFK